VHFLRHFSKIFLRYFPEVVKNAHPFLSIFQDKKKSSKDLSKKY